MLAVQEKVQVLWNKQIGPAYYTIGLNCHAGYTDAMPGQFVMVRIVAELDPLLRRPFSIHKLIAEEARIRALELLYKVVGSGTKKLSRQKPGDVIDILGPLGKGFFVPAKVQRIFIVAGGVGVAPMPFLVSHLKAKKIDLSNCKVFLGGRSKDDLLCLNDFSSLGVPVHTTTDDGSLGDQCWVTDPFETELVRRRPDIIYACGPLDMLACIIAIAEKYEIACQVSIETLMACGVGACLGCAIENRNEPGSYFHACADGPVFNAKVLKI